jgi:putative ABC transport system permease protein
MGRMFSAKDAEQQQRLVLISYRFWQTRFGGSAEAIGASIDLDGLPSRVIGIVPATLPRFLVDANIWEPHTMVPDWGPSQCTWRRVLAVVGRLRPNVTFEQRR